MASKIIIGIVAAVTFFLIINPLYLGIFYLLVKPLIQPYANQGYTIFPGVPLTGVFALVFIMVSTLACFFRRDYSLFHPRLIPIYLLLFFSVMSFSNSIDYMMSFANLLKFVTGISMYLLLYNSIKTRGDANKLLYAIVIASIIPMIYGYYQFIEHVASAHETRIESLFGMYNAYGEFLSVTFCATLMLLLQPQKQSHRTFLICIIASLLLSMILSKNRGQWIALLIGLSFSYLFYMGKIKIKWVIISGALIAIIFSGVIINRFAELNEKKQWGGSKNTFESRLSNWKDCLQLVPRHPIVGYGIGTAKLLKMNRGSGSVPHNDYVRLALETGVPSLLCYVAFLLGILFANLKLALDKTNWFVNYPMLVLIVYWMIHSIVQNMIYNVIVFTMFMATLALSTKWSRLDLEEGSG